MYVDNELQQAERLEVERFVQQNLDLATELHMLQEATLQTEDITFDQKDLLYKKEEGISLSNYEEYFILSVDEELNKTEADEVEKFVLKHPTLQDEFTLLKQTKLAPEVIEFTGKEALYKTEKERRVVPFGWMRASVAAAVIGLIAFTFIYTNNPTKTGSQVVTTAFAKPNPEQTQKKPGSTVTQQAVRPLENKTGKVQPAVAQTQNTKPDKTQNAKPGSEYVAGLKKKTDLASEKITVTKSPALATVSERPKEIIDNSLPVRNNDRVIVNNPTNTIFAGQKNTTEDTQYATNAVYREVDTNEEDNSVYIGGAEINKNKLKGLFKKAAKFLGKKGSENDDEKTVQIAGFRFKTK